MPARFRPCCDEFAARTVACSFDVRYEWWPQRRGWFVVIAESAGGGGIAVNFCPHCAARLQGRLHAGRWFDLGT